MSGNISFFTIESSKLILFSIGVLKVPLYYSVCVCVCVCVYELVPSTPHIILV
jgi:hypothetical protein